MINNNEILESAIQTIEMESKAILNLKNKLNNQFIEVVKYILTLNGRVVVTGIGKSAIIGQKIVATLNSTGTPAIFMHAADAIHGDLGIIQKDDLVIAISKSGNTPEIKVLVPFVKQMGNKLVALVGNESSFLATQADFVLDTTVESEACTNNLAPTSSTTAQLAMGDAVAVALQKARDFSDKDFAKYHPGGSLGKKLYLKVGELSDNNGKPEASKETSIKDLIFIMTKHRLGAAVVVENDLPIGIVTDGDIRRMLEKHDDFKGLKAEDIMSPSPKAIDREELAADALHVMRENNISQLIVSNQGKYDGIVHFHDLLKEGII